MNRKIKKLGEFLKNSLFNIEEYRASQIKNYLITLACVFLIKIFSVLLIGGDAFVSIFEICVWIFMVFSIFLRGLNSFSSLKGYWMFSGIPLIVFLMVRDCYWLMDLSFGILAICKIIEIILLFKNREEKK